MLINVGLILALRAYYSMHKSKFKLMVLFKRVHKNFICKYAFTDTLWPYADYFVEPFPRLHLNSKLMSELLSQSFCIR